MNLWIDDLKDQIAASGDHWNTVSYPVLNGERIETREKTFTVETGPIGPELSASLIGKANAEKIAGAAPGCLMVKECQHADASGQSRVTFKLRDRRWDDFTSPAGRWLPLTDAAGGRLFPPADFRALIP